MNALLLDDFRHAVRRLRKDAGTTIASVAALACGIGAAVATWSLVSAVLLNPLPVAEPERLFQLDVPPPFPNVAARWVPGYTYPVLEAFRDSGAFDGIAAGGGQTMLVVEQGDTPQARGVYFADRDFFATLGIRAARGRTFAPDEDRRGAPPVAVLSDRYWRTVFNADPNVLGRNVTVAGLSATVIGVLPRGFRGLHLSGAPDLYLPLQVIGDIDRRQLFSMDPLGPGIAWIQIVGRLHAGETPATVAARLNAMDCVCRRDLTHAEVSPITLTNVNVAAVPQLARAGTAQFATLLAITVGLLLLAGCLTVAMLLLVRTEDRRDELAVRLALGATRGRLAVSIAVEAVALCALGAVLAVPFALWFFYGVRAFQLPGSIDLERLELTLAFVPLLAVTGAALAATAVFASVAGLVGAATAVHSPREARALATPRVTRRAPRAALIAGQVAITLVLVTGAGLFARSLAAALTLNSAVDTDRIAMAFVSLGPHGYTPERATAFVDELLERLRQNGAIESAGVLRNEGGVEPGFPDSVIEIDGVVRELPASLSYGAVDESFFSTLGLPIVSGRGFAASDTAGSPPVAVVSESLGRFIADGGNPVGRRIGPLRVGASPVYPEIIGVVPDFITEVGRTEPLVAYQLIAQRPPSVFATLFFRSAGDPSAAMREAMAATRALDARVTLGSMMTLDEQIGRQMNPQRFGVYVLGGLGGIALLLTALGTYVIAESLVVRRRRELGIRAALGARAAQLRGLVLRDTARLVGIGLVAGVALAIAGARLIRSLLYRVEPLDPLVLVVVAGGILGLALLVSLRPALAAGSQDLVRSLREE
jgi:putative ABC transport system permease protein